MGFNVGGRGKEVVPESDGAASDVVGDGIEDDDADMNPWCRNNPSPQRAREVAKEETTVKETMRE